MDRLANRSLDSNWASRVSGGKGEVVMAELRAAIGKMRLGRATGLLAPLVVAAALVATGCGSSSSSSGGGGSSSSSSGSGSSAGQTNIGLILAGPKDDQSSNQDAYERVSS